MVVNTPYDCEGFRPEVHKTVERLLGIAKAMEVNVEWADLGSHRRGEYRDDEPLIRLNSRLRDFQVTATLGHEIVHAMYRDRDSSPRNEARARLIGAALSLDPVMIRQGRSSSAVHVISDLRTAIDLMVVENGGQNAAWATPG